MTSLIARLTRPLPCFAAVALALPLHAASRPNVLFIAADDLRAELGCYGSAEAKTPNLDALAKRGVLFERAYCQQAVCNPSRASLLTGLRPDTLKVWDLKTNFRVAQPDVVTLPQYFKQAGYTTLDIGKIFHNEVGAKVRPLPFNDPVSWSQAPVYSKGAHWQDWVIPGSPEGPKVKQGAVQCLDVPDNAYIDGRIADAAVAKLAELKASGEPFFLAVGFWKPHLPFNAPKKYWDLYDRAKLSMPFTRTLPRGAPAMAGHPSEELRNYDGIPDGELPPAQVAELRHGYFANISFLDAQVGRVVAELDRLGLAGNTIIVFVSDHGYHIGERDLWGKTTNYELDTRAPLMMAAPGIKPAHTRALVEFVDIYPTLAELAGLPPAAGLQGASLVPLLRDPAQPGKAVALSQHPRPYHDGTMTHMGYSFRTDRYHYIEWRDFHTGAVTARELYDATADPRETVNAVADPANAAVVAQLEAQARALVPPTAR